MALFKNSLKATKKEIISVNTPRKSNYFTAIILLIALSLFLTSCSSNNSKETIAKPCKDMFSKKIKYKSKKISINKILDYIEDVDEYEDDENLIDAKSTESYTDYKLGVSVTVKNNTKKERYYKNCDILSVTFSKKNITFPGGVKVGMKADKVCNSKSGIYGSPDDYSGSALYGLGLEDTNAIYTDEKGKKQIIIGIDSYDNTITSITYKKIQSKKTGGSK